MGVLIVNEASVNERGAGEVILGLAITAASSGKSSLRLLTLHLP